MIVRIVCLFILAMVSSITVAGEIFKVDRDYLRKYDIVYLDPDYNGYNGFPLGNGDLGGMIWTTENGIRLQINKIDLYNRPQNDMVSLKAAGQVSIDFGVPVNDYLYLSDFEHRLSLLDAETNLKSETAFAKTKLKSWLDVASNVWILECEADYKAPYVNESGVEITLERWGSRHFGDWYNSCEKDVASGLGKTRMTQKGNDVVLNESLDGGLDFSVACRVLDASSMSQVVNRHKAVLRLDNQRHHKFYVLISVATSEKSDNPSEEAMKMLDNITSKGIACTYREHMDWWHSFWNKSFVSLDEDYIENIYYLRRYLAASSSRGNYPVPFNGGLWVWNHDHRQWTTPVHWNAQQSCWGLAEQNDPELMKPYIETYFRAMPKAEKFTSERYGMKNALSWSEVHDFDGNMLHADRGDMKYNFTPASQIAANFWNYYEFTGDKSCLNDTIYPFMKKAAEFYLQKLQWDDQKKEYYIYPAQPYEHPYTSNLKNPITDRYMIESLFGNCIKAAKILKKDKEKVKQWEKVITHLWEPPVLDVPDRGKVFVMAYSPDGNVYPNMDTYYRRQFYHCDAHTTMVFPANVLGLDQSGTEYFDIAKNVALHHPADRNAITPGAIVSARLGLGNKVMERLGNMISYLQHFNQGLFYNIDHWHVLSRYAKTVDNAQLLAQRDYVFDSRSYYRSYAGNSGMWAQPFVQCGMEPIHIFGTAVNEMLLQSHEGKIRVFPAWPQGKEMAFTLRARGAFVVSSYINKEGVIPGVEIESLNGGDCRVQNPWGHKDIQVTSSNGNKIRFSVNAKGVISFKTSSGETYLVNNLKSSMNNEVEFKSAPNHNVKKFKEATLGKERTFMVAK